MEDFFSLKTFLRLLAGAIVLAAIIVLIGERKENSQTTQYIQEVEVTRQVAQTVLVTRIVEQVVSVTPEATPTHPSSQTVTDTATIIPISKPLEVLENGLSIWCLPKNSYEEIKTIETGQIPQDAIPAKVINDELTVITQLRSCTFMVAFNQDVPVGVRLKIQDLSPKTFIDEELIPLETDATVALITSDHYYIVEPPYWTITYTISVYSPENEILLEEPVVFRRNWIPELCPNGLLPDVTTALCDS